MDYSPWGHKKSDMTEQLSSCANIENMDFPGLSGLKKKKNPSANAEDTGSIPESGRSSGERMATHSSILVWEIRGTEEPGRLQSLGSQRVRHDLATKQLKHIRVSTTLLWCVFIVGVTLGTASGSGLGPSGVKRAARSTICAGGKLFREHPCLGKGLEAFGKKSLLC